MIAWKFAFKGNTSIYYIYKNQLISFQELVFGTVTYFHLTDDNIETLLNPDKYDIFLSNLSKEQILKLKNNKDNNQFNSKYSIQYHLKCKLPTSKLPC